MRDHSIRIVRVSLGLMTLASYLALATTDAFGPEISIIPLVLMLGMPVFERIDARFPGYRRVTGIITLAFTILIIPFLLRDLITALTLTVIYIQTYLFLHHKRVRDYRYLFLMAFFLLVDAVAQSPDPAFGLVMPFFVLSAVWAFGSLQVYAETLDNEQGNIADILPSDPRRGFLPPEVAIWVSGQRRDGVSIAPILTALSIACVIGTLLLFMLTPRMEAGVFGRSNVMTSTLRSDITDSVNLSRGGTIAADETTVFMVRFPNEAGGQPPLSARLWRVTTFNRLTGSEWEREPGGLDRGAAEPRSFEGGLKIARNPAGDGKQIEQEIFLENAESIPGLPVLSGVVTVTMPRNARAAWDQTDGSSVLLVRSSEKSLQYKAISEVRNLPLSRLRSAPGNYDEVFQGGLQRDLRLFTSERLSERGKALARNLTAGLTSPYDQVNAIHQYLRSDRFLYTTSLKSLPEDDPIDAFLFVQQGGHCELYASAMCMLVRSLGIPARVVSGYKDGEWSETDKAYIIRKKNAHLWVEVYLNDIGWWAFDPSGVAVTDNSSWARLQRAVTRYALNAKILYYRDIIGFSSGIQLGNMVNFTIGLFQFDFEVMRRSLPSIGFFSTGLPRMVLTVLIGITIAWAVFLLYHSSRLRRQMTVRLRFTEDQARATRLYGRLRGRLHRLGVPGNATTARELLAEVQQDAGLNCAAVESIVRAYNDVRFGGRPLSKVRYMQLIRTIGQIRRARESR